MKKWQTLSLTLALPLMSWGCTNIDIQGVGAAVSVTHLGIMRVSPATDTAVTVVNIRGVGIVPSSNGVTIGVSKETFAMLKDPHDCRVIFFIESGSQAEAAIKILEDQSLKKDICQIKGE